MWWKLPPDVRTNWGVEARTYFPFGGRPRHIVAAPRPSASVPTNHRRILSFTGIRNQRTESRLDPL
jgi:hypothetical protein